MTDAALDEGAWWHEMGLPRTASREQIDARYANIRLQRFARPEDLDRLNRAYAVAILQAAREDAADACHDRHINED